MATGTSYVSGLSKIIYEIGESKPTSSIDISEGTGALPPCMISRNGTCLVKWSDWNRLKAALPTIMALQSGKIGIPASDVYVQVGTSTAASVVGVLDSMEAQIGALEARQ